MKKSTMFLGIFVFVGSSFAALAADTELTNTAPIGTVTGGTFNNHLKSNIVVSPAQIYQVEGLRNEFQLGYENGKDETSTGVAKDTSNLTGTKIDIGGVYAIGTTGARVGLSLNDTNTKVTAKSPSMTTGETETSTDTRTDISFTAKASYTILDQIVLGVAAEMGQSTFKSDSIKTTSIGHNTITPGALFKSPTVEAGLAYQPKTDIKKDVTTDTESFSINASTPSVTSLHSRVALSDTLAVGGILQNNAYSSVGSTLKDQNVLTATGEYTIDAVKIEATAGYGGAFYKDKTVASTNNIATTTLTAAADYAVNPTTAVGAGLAFDFGSEKVNDTTLAKSDMNMALRAKMNF